MEDFGILWIWGFCGDSHRFFCGYGMGMGIKIQSPRQPCRIQSFHMQALRRILGIRWYDKVSNAGILLLTDVIHYLVTSGEHTCFAGTATVNRSPHQHSSRRWLEAPAGSSTKKLAATSGRRHWPCRVLSLSDCKYSLNPLNQTRIDWVGRYRIRWTFKLCYAWRVRVVIIGVLLRIKYLLTNN